MVECSVCGADITFDPRAEVNEIISCSECGSELEIISLDPPTVQAAPQEEEDWGE